MDGVSGSALTRDDLKRLILRALTDNPRRHHHRRDIIGKPFAKGAIEGLLGRTLDGNERALAGRLVRELEDAGLVRATYSALQDGEKWIEITDSGLAALEADVLDPLDAVLRSVEPHLVVIRRGAWSALESGQPDSLRQAAHSGRELIDQLLKIAAPDELVRAQPNFEPSRKSSSGITRRMRLRNIMKSYRGFISDTDLEVAETASELFERVDDKLKGLSHSRTMPTADDVRDSLLAAEIALLTLPPKLA